MNQFPDIARLTEHVNKLVSDLSEHCDSVRIFVSLTENSVTHAFTTGKGNFYSQFGQVQEWLTKQEEYIKKEQ